MTDTAIALFDLNGTIRQELLLPDLPGFPGESKRASRIKQGPDSDGDGF